MERFLRNIEFAFCLSRAMLTSNSGHIHCIESQHQMLIQAVLRSTKSISTLCVGSPGRDMKTKTKDFYRRAFSTGRLRFIVETEDVRRDWKQYAGCNAVHIPVAISDRSEIKFCTSDARRHLGLPEDAFICLFFGTHRDGKDYKTAFQAAKLAKSQPFLLFAGPLISGNDPDYLIQEMGYQNALSWKRFYLDSEAAVLFDACDVVMLPYSKGYEKGSAVLLQACKYGKPVIATNTGHLAEFVLTHKTGMLFEAEDAHSLAGVYDAMACQGPAARAELERVIRRAANNYSWNHLIHRYLEIFNMADG